MHVLALVASVGQVLDDEVDVFVYEQIEHGAAPVESTIDCMRAQKPESLAVIPPERRHAASAPGLDLGGFDARSARGGAAPALAYGQGTRPGLPID